eukprot:gene7594-biopygen27
MIQYARRARAPPPPLPSPCGTVSCTGVSSAQWGETLATRTEAHRMWAPQRPGPVVIAVLEPARCISHGSPGPSLALRGLHSPWLSGANGTPVHGHLYTLAALGCAAHTFGTGASRLKRPTLSPLIAYLALSTTRTEGGFSGLNYAMGDRWGKVSDKTHTAFTARMLC